jgi:hypothetical protein
MAGSDMAKAQGAKEYKGAKPAGVGFLRQVINDEKYKGGEQGQTDVQRKSFHFRQTHVLLLEKSEFQNWSQIVQQAPVAENAPGTVFVGCPGADRRPKSVRSRAGKGPDGAGPLLGRGRSVSCFVLVRIFDMGQNRAQ